MTGTLLSAIFAVIASRDSDAAISAELSLRRSAATEAIAQ